MQVLCTFCKKLVPQKGKHNLKRIILIEIDYSDHECYDAALVMLLPEKPTLPPIFTHVMDTMETPKTTNSSSELLDPYDRLVDARVS